MNFKSYLKERDISLLKLSKDTGIPYSTLATGIEKPESMRVENLYKISQYLGKTLDEIFKMLSEKKSKTLLDILKEQKTMKLKGNIYHYTQIKFAYNTNRIEGSKLSEDETRFIFETNTLISKNEIQNIDDIVETANHFYLFDVMLEKADILLNEELIKEYHKILKQGTEDSRKEWFNVGEYKSLANEVGGKETTKPKDVEKEIKKLLNWYNLLEVVTLKEIVEFHYRFEKIHPFQDGNGRVGRAIMFKECLKYNIVPFIIEDSFKAFYYRGLSNYEEEKGFLEETCLAMQDNYKEVIKKFLS
jgi:Fic family protein